MEKVNMHGLEIVGLKKLSGYTYNRRGRDNSYDEIFYDKESHEVWNMWHSNLNWFSHYENPNYIKVGNCFKHLTMQEIADMVADALEKEEAV